MILFEKSDLSEGVEMGEKIWYNIIKTKSRRGFAR